MVIFGRAGGNYSYFMYVKRSSRARCTRRTVAKRYPNREVEAFGSLLHSFVVITDVTSYYETKIVAD